MFRRLTILTFLLMVAAMVAPAIQAVQPTNSATSTAQGPAVGCAIDLMLVLDGSGSISDSDFGTMKGFVGALLASFDLGPAGANIGLIQFSDGAQLVTGLSDDANELTTALASMAQFGGGTNIPAGIELAQQQLGNGRSGVPPVMIVLTDGVSDADPIPAANAARADGSTVYGIAVGGADLDQISAIAGGDRNVILVDNFAGLEIILDVLLLNTCAVLNPRDTQIVFASERDGDLEIFTIDPTGENLTQLTFNEAFDDKPSWSKDGTRIAWESDMDGDFEIFTMNADGSNQQQITFNDVDDWGPAWSPDGQRIAFHSERDGDVELFIMDADGSDVQQVTQNNGPVDRSASWSPGGRLLVYYSDSSGGRELYISDVQGEGARRLTSNAFYDGLPDWSLNGTELVFASTREQADVEIYTMRVDGQNVRRLTSSPGVDDDPVWSPDSKQIVFESERAGNLDIWIMDADGGNLRQLTSDPARDWSADWIWKPQ